MAYGYSQGGAYSWKKFGAPRKPASELKSAEARAKREQSDKLAALPPPRPVTTLAQMSPEKQEEMRRLYKPPENMGQRKKRVLRPEVFNGLDMENIHKLQQMRKGELYAPLTEAKPLKEVVEDDVHGE